MGPESSCMTGSPWLVAAVAAALLIACGDGGRAATPTAPARSTDAVLPSLPAHFPPVLVPAGNPLTAEKVELGRHLFFDRRLSGNGEQSCASCHRQELAFSDGLNTAVGSTGEIHPRNSSTLTNVAYNLSFNWADPTLLELEQQNIRPIVSSSPIVELGVTEDKQQVVLQRFRDAPLYQSLFAAAFPTAADPFTLEHIVKALASFNRTLLSYRAPIDRFLAGEDDALSQSARRGLALFESDRLECTQCHGGFNFSDSSKVSGAERPPFHNTGLYNIFRLTEGANNYPAENQGLFAFSGEVSDKGRMRAPTLRNISLTAPYNHDGSTATLAELLDNYARGGRLVSQPLEHAGDGRGNVYKDGELHGFSLSEQDTSDLLAFFDSLTDQAFITDPSHADPFPQGKHRR